MSIVVIDRVTGERFEEIVAGENFLQWGYGTAFGRAFMDVVGSKKTMSWVVGLYQNSRLSKRHIHIFAKELGINMDEAERSDPSSYTSFNDFFSRNLKKEARMIDEREHIVVSPADARVFAYQFIEGDTLIQAKDRYYSLSALLTDEGMAECFEGGSCVVSRLNPADYHRFHLPVNCVPGPTLKVAGRYYSVNPVALNAVDCVYSRNTRHITYLQTEASGMIGMVEVGASMVGSVVQTFTAGNALVKGEEKGFFQFGGSTVILLFQPGTINLDGDLVSNTKEGYETMVKMGQRIGTTKDVKQE